MKRSSRRGSTARFFGVILTLSLGCLQAGCAGGSAHPAVLRESEALLHLPRGTRISPPDSPDFEIAPPDGMWLVTAGYLARMYELLGISAAEDRR